MSAYLSGTGMGMVWYGIVLREALLPVTIDFFHFER